MRLMAMGLAVSGAALVVGAVLLAQWAQFPGSVFQIIGGLLVDADPLAKLVVLLLAMALMATLWMGVGRLLAKTPEPTSDGLTVISYAGPGLGLAAGAYGGLNISIAMKATGTTNLMIIAPSVAEAVLVVGLGLLVGAAASGFGAARRTVASQA